MLKKLRNGHVTQQSMRLVKILQTDEKKKTYWDLRKCLFLKTNKATGK